MPKAKTIDRIELTKQKMAAREAQRHGHGLVCEVTSENLEQVQKEVLGYTKENSRFLKMVAEMKKEHPELAALDDEHTCPVCGGEVIPYEGCYRCKKCGWARC